MNLQLSVVDEMILNALKEDVGTGDVTSESIIPNDYIARGIIHAKESGVVAGIPIAERVFKILSSNITFLPLKKDGDAINKGDIIAEINGSAKDILTGERVALNFLQRLSGIATQTRLVADKLSNYDTNVVDTRKTTPGLRMLEKYAVRIGGGSNHRFGLYDGVLIKDNHIKVAGGIKNAVELARKNAPHTLKVEVEVEDIKGVKEALEAKADIIMLDNMNNELIKEALEIINSKALVEVSGGITNERVTELAELGVDIISMGSLTHTIKSLDLSLDVGEIKGRE